MTLLLVEDDMMLGRALVDGLRGRFQIDWVCDVAAAEDAIATGGYDLVLLDLTLPDGSGLDLLTRGRRGRNVVPIIILTARDGLADRLAGLNGGADDFVIKPFDLDELIARCDAIIRRMQGRAEPEIIHGALCYRPTAQTVTLAGVALPLSAREITVLDVLLTNIGRVNSKSQIEARLYRWDEAVESNTVEVYISHLRRKIGRDFIQTIRGLGYVVPRLATTADPS